MCLKENRVNSEQRVYACTSANPELPLTVDLATDGMMLWV
jgi:hypothetical protein